MNKLKITLLRFILNFIFYAMLLVTSAYYLYTYIPELYGLKNVILPLKSIIVFTIILSFILALVNEIMTVLIIRIISRKKR